ncbi:hypothetical protein Ocin01_14348 [Orchesella cincta]|uniref:Uncharacterized protein n=1 Tax=Orchesella cincta TaxID=48709 RepID=A0A1D2MH82_ORCCI|nr:hypothetical protein Ocin01_14348 [Orchesella cincta]
MPSPGLPDNLSYKNSNAFHSKSNSPTSLHSFFIHQHRNNYYCYHHHRYCAQCQQLSPFSDCFSSKKKTISSLPILWTEASSRIACCLAFPHQRPLINCRGEFGGGCSSGLNHSANASSHGICSVAKKTFNYCSSKNYEKILSAGTSQFSSVLITPSSLHQEIEIPVRGTVNKTVLKIASSSEPHKTDNDNDNKGASQTFKCTLHERRDRQSWTSTVSQSVVPKIEIVICTELHGSTETKVIRPNKTYRDNGSSSIRLNTRALSDSPRVETGMDQGSSSVHLDQPDESANSLTSIIVVDGKTGGRKKMGGRSNGATATESGDGQSKNRSTTGGWAFRILSFINNMAKCCFTNKGNSSQSINGAGDGNISGIFVEGSYEELRGLFNTRSFTMNSDVQATLGNRSSIAMKSEFNPALLFDPAYRKSRISELGIAGIGLEPPGQIPIGTFNRMNRSRSLWNVSNEDYWNRPPPSRPVSMGYVNHIHQLDQLNAHKDCCHSVNNNSNATMNLNKQMILKGFGGCSQGYRNPIHGSTTSIATSNHPGGGTMHESVCGGILRDPDHRRNWLATGRRAQSVDGLNHFFHRYYGRNIAAHHNLHPGGILSSDHHSQDWSKSSLCHEEPPEDLRSLHVVCRLPENIKLPVYIYANEDLNI